MAQALRRTVLTLGGLLSLLTAGTSLTAVAQGTARSLSSATSYAFPTTTVGKQANWFVTAANHPPIPTAQIRAHFDSNFLDQVSPSYLNSLLNGITGVVVNRVTTSTATTIVFVVTVGTADGPEQWTVSMAVDPPGLISGLFLQPAGSPKPPPVPTTWAAALRMFRSAAPDVHFLVAAVHGASCQALEGGAASTPAPLGSAFKLYVLDALSRAILAGKVQWDRELTITAANKSLPSGVLQERADGSKVTVEQAATYMISISDNTAANMLAELLGRNAVEAATHQAGMARPGLDIPFLTTRELFILKLDNWPKLANTYLALPPRQRATFLASTVDQEPLPPAATWGRPRDVGSLEWFASPMDMCRVFADLRALADKPALRPLDKILSTNDGGMGLPPNTWRTTWFKGGSEPGVLTLSYMATATDGRTYVVSVLTEDPRATIPNDAVVTLLSAIEGAFQLANGPS